MLTSHRCNLNVFLYENDNNDGDRGQMEVFEENEWWVKIEQMKRGGEQEMVIKRNFCRGDQEILGDMAYQLGLYL